MTVRRHRITLLVLAVIAVLGGVVAAPPRGQSPDGSEALAGLVGGIALGIALLLVAHYRLGVDLPADVHTARPLVPRPPSRALSIVLGIAVALGVGVLYAVARSTSSAAAVPVLLAAGAGVFVSSQLLSATRRP